MNSKVWREMASRGEGGWRVRKRNGQSGEGGGVEREGWRWEMGDGREGDGREGDGRDGGMGSGDGGRE